MKGLILDDYKDVSEVIAPVLEESGVVHKIFFDPLEALEGMKVGIYDFAFIDISLPNMNGLELSKFFKGKFPEADIIFITENSDYDKAVQAIKIGVYDFLQKPLKRLDIMMCLRRLREKRKLYQDQKQMEVLKFANDVALQLMDEIRNPLVVIGGFARRISAMDYPEGKLKEYTKMIFDETLRLEEVLDKVLLHLRAGSQHISS